MEITKDQFAAYEAVRASGVTNMWNVSLVCKLADLSKEEVLEIMKHYGELNVQYPNVRKQREEKY